MFSIKKTQDENLSGINSFVYWILLITTVTLPVFVLFNSSVSTLMVKNFIGGVLVFVILASFAISHIVSQKITIPKSYILFSVWLLPIAYVLSSLFAKGKTYFFGNTLSMDSVGFMLVVAIAVTITAIILNTAKRALGIYLAMLVSAFLLTIFEIVLFFMQDSVQIFGLKSVSLLGSLNDLAMFFGLIAIFVLLSLVMLPVTMIVRFVLWLVLIVALFFLTVVNLNVLWWMLGGFSVAIFVYSITSSAFTKSSSTKRKISWASLFVFLVSALFLFGSASITDAVSKMANVGEFDVRPSWSTTVSVGSQSFSNGNMVFGSGPGTFYHEWAQYMPESINATSFWLADFFYGIGLIPTSVITTGMLGAIAWIMFFITFLFVGVKVFLYSDTSKLGIVTYLRVTSFVASLYLWVNAIIQIPSPALILYAAIFTGMFVSTVNLGSNKNKIFELNFKDNPKIGFIVTLILTVAVLGSFAGIYKVSEHYIAELNYQDSVKVALADDNIDLATDLLNKAISHNKVDAYYRFLSNIYVVKAQKIISQSKNTDDIKVKLQDNLSGAIKNAIEATKIDKLGYKNWVNLGNVYKSMTTVGVGNAVENSISAYDKALELRPSSPSVYYDKAQLEKARGDNKKAREYVEKAISLRNQYTDAIFLLAQIQAEENDIENAINSVKAIILFEPKNAVAYFQLGLLYYASEDFVGAAQALEKAISINPEYANARYFLGLSYWRLGNYKATVEQFTEVQKTNPDNVEVRNILKNLKEGKEPFANFKDSSKIQNINGLPITNIDDGSSFENGNENLSE